MQKRGAECGHSTLLAGWEAHFGSSLNNYTGFRAMGCAGSVIKSNQVANIDDNEPDEKDDLGAVPPTIIAQISRDGSSK